jgi:hypothetical protein
MNIFGVVDLNADPDPVPDPGGQTNGQTLRAQKVEFLDEKYT